MRRWMLLAPLVLFLAMAALLYRGLYLDPSELPSALIGKPFPEFSLPAVQDGNPVLTKLAEQGVVIYGVNYKDVNADAVKWLSEFHDPYQLNINDEAGSLGLNLGVYGAPETFLIDARGVIRYKHVGVIDQTVWREKLAGQYQALVEEGTQ
jgi:cytochrome c biogenesis protein CcmG/thiol:disulfide interchange protein DsbE